MDNGSPTSHRPVHRATLSDPGGRSGHIPLMVTEPEEEIDAFPSSPPSSPPPTATFSPTHHRNQSLGVSTSPTVGRPGLRQTSRRQLRSSTTTSPWLTETGLFHIDVPRKFGEVGDYWKYYDELAERHDKDMIGRLGDNLDILLIFAGLFSAINTSFLLLSLPNLSPDPNAHSVRLLTLIAQGTPTSDPTALGPGPFNATEQNIVVNAFLSASLSCSLLAAFGAVIAKQWVLYFARSQVGTLETQGRARQRKLNGVSKWQFQHVVEALPILLQLSLVFFFIGFILYLHNINSLVSFIVTGFFLVGTVLYTITLWVAVFDPLSPFQSPLSIFIRNTTLAGWRLTYRHLRALARRLRLARDRKKELAEGPPPSVFKALPLAGLSLGAATGIVHHTQHQAQRLERRRTVRPISLFGTPRGAPKEKPSSSVAPTTMMMTAMTNLPNRIQVHFQDKRIAEEETIDNQTACWILATSEHTAALLSAARNVPALRRVADTELAIDGLAFHRLLSLFRESLNAFRSAHHAHSMELLDAAIIYGRALGHAIVGSPSASDAALGTLSRGLQWPRWRANIQQTDSNELILLKCVITAEIPRDFCINHSREQMPHPSSALPIYTAALLEPSVEARDFRVSARKVDRIALVMWLVYSSLSAHDAAVSPRLVAFNAWAIAELPAMICNGKHYFNADLRKKWWNMYTSEVELYPTLVSALGVYHHYHRLPTALKSPSTTTSGAAATAASPSQKDAQTAASNAQDFLKVLNGVSFVEIYTRLLYTARGIIDMGSQYQETLNDWTMELDGALRQMLFTIRDQMKSADGALGAGLRSLEDEVQWTMKSLRRDGVDAMVPKLEFTAEYPGTESVEGGGGGGLGLGLALNTLDFDRDLDHFDKLTFYTHHSSLPAVLVGALQNSREGTRYASLAIIHDHISVWLSSSPPSSPLGDRSKSHHAVFQEAQLVTGLYMCLSDEENFELVSGILAHLLPVKLWRDEIVSCFLLNRYHVKALELFNAPHKPVPSLRTLEMYLTVWNVARRYPSCASFVGETVESDVVLLNVMLKLGGRAGGPGVPQPYVPEALAEFVAYVKDVRGAEQQHGRRRAEEKRKRIQAAYEEVERCTMSGWWNLVES